MSDGTDDKPTDVSKLVAAAVMALDTTALPDRPDWTYQDVQEGDFAFDRAYIPFRGRRLAVHVHRVGGGEFFHPHLTALGVAILGWEDAEYRLRLAVEDEKRLVPIDEFGRGLKPVADLTFRARPHDPLVYYGLSPGTYHDVQVRSGWCATVCIFGNPGDTALGTLPMNVQVTPGCALRWKLFVERIRGRSKKS